MASITEQTSECPTLSYHALYRLPTGYASEVWQVPWRVRRYTHPTETTCIWWILMPSHPLKKWIVTDKTNCIWYEQVCVCFSYGRRQLDLNIEGLDLTCNICTLFISFSRHSTLYKQQPKNWHIASVQRKWNWLRSNSKQTVSITICNIRKENKGFNFIEKIVSISEVTVKH